MRTFVITGAAGFIGSAVAKSLLDLGHRVIGLDNFSSHYDVGFKQARTHALLGEFALSKNYEFFTLDIREIEKLKNLTNLDTSFEVLHFAAQPGVQDSLINPKIYFENNIEGSFSVLEFARKYHAQQIVFASSSTVYGNSTGIPSSESMNAEAPLSFYAASKRSGELMAQTYSKNHGLKTRVLRFFTVYGPWGRPDMAIFKFADAIFHGKPLKLYQDLPIRRDFTFIDDVVDGILDIIRDSVRKQDGTAGSTSSEFEVYNIGRGDPRNLETVIQLLEENLGRSAEREYFTARPGDSRETWADIKKIQEAFNFFPKISLEEGIRRFSLWYLAYQAQLLTKNSEVHSPKFFDSQI